MSENGVYFVLVFFLFGNILLDLRALVVSYALACFETDLIASPLWPTMDWFTYPNDTVSEV